MEKWRISPSCFISSCLSLSLFSASDGSVFQSDGKNRQGEEDVVSDTVHVTGRYRPEIGECVVMFYFHSCPCLDSLWFSMNLNVGVYFIEHSDLLERAVVDILVKFCKMNILLLFLINLNTFTVRPMVENSEKHPVDHGHI